MRPFASNARYSGHMLKYQRRSRELWIEYRTWGTPAINKTATVISVDCSSSATRFSMLLDEGTYAVGPGFNAHRELSGSAGSLTTSLRCGNGGAKPFVVFAPLSVPTTSPPVSHADRF